MSEFNKLFWDCSLEELKNGYILNDEEGLYVCLICGQEYEDGIIYEIDGIQCQASKAVRAHIVMKHRSVFHFLLNQDKKYTSLTDHQKSLLEMYYEGSSDKEIASKQGGSVSTLRNQRFNFREKEKQSRIFLAIMELLKKEAIKKGTQDKGYSENELIDFPRTAKNIDERFAITRKEYEKILVKHFQDGLDEKLTSFPNQEKKIVAILIHIAQNFDNNRTYNEKEINEVLKKVYSDYVKIRRYLIEYGFLDRVPDGSSYWVRQ